MKTSSESLSILGKKDVYEICKKCGIKRNLSISTNCPICDFEELPIAKEIKKEFSAIRSYDKKIIYEKNVKLVEQRDQLKEEVGRLREMREALGKNIKILWKMSFDLQK